MTRTLNLNIKTTEQYLLLFQHLFGLTPMEIEILAKFIDIEQDLTKKSIMINPFSTPMRRKVAEAIGKDISHMGNYIKRLKDKGAIDEIEGGYKINNLLKPWGVTKLVFNVK